MVNWSKPGEELATGRVEAGKGPDASKTAISFAGPRNAVTWLSGTHDRAFSVMPWIVLSAGAH